MSKLPGLDKAAPIVYPDGRITPYFQRFWQNLQLVFAAGATAVDLLTDQVVNGLKTFVSGIRLGGSSGPRILSGTGVPGLSAPVGSLYVRTDGGTGSTLYVHEDAGWVAK